ncbi:MAG: phosphoglycerate dehydrogenase [Patescibacteria group bacterium]
MNNRYFIIDFDSTFLTLESLDVLAEISLVDNPDRENILLQIKGITQLGMEGKLKFDESLKKRLELFKTDKSSIQRLIPFLKKSISPSVVRNKEFFKKHSKQIYIISGGFKDYIVPVVEAYGIEKDHVLANDFKFDSKEKVTGFNSRNLLSQKGGKIMAVKSLKLKGEVLVVGDGYTDYEIRKSGAASKFYAFTENVKRGSVINLADYVANTFDEVLFDIKEERALSFPKSKMKVLLLENIDDAAVQAFRKEGYIVEVVNKALSENELIKKIKNVSILGIRSKTEVTREILRQADRLLAVGAFCIGVNQIDLSACAARGICVFNAPYSNTRSVVEITIAEIIMLFRRVIDKSQGMHNGIWDKSAKASHEIRGKTLGIIGYGNIGMQLSVLAENLGMKVLFFDTSEKLALGNAKKCKNLGELLKHSDVITVHVDGRKNNANLIGEPEFRKMKTGVIFLNLSRGFVVDLDSLARNIKEKKINGAAIDVFPKEPRSNGEEFRSILRGLPNIILTPHIAGSTEEAQRNIGEFVSQRLINYIDSGATILSVNFPALDLTSFKKSHRLIHIHANTPGVLAKFNGILAKYKINIEGQYLGTNNEIGYVITDVNKKYSKEVLSELKSIPETIKFRILY